MSVRFRCKISGNTVVFNSQDDIDSMRREEGYVEVTEQESKVVDAVEPALPDQTNKPRGRPRKGN